MKAKPIIILSAICMVFVIAIVACSPAVSPEDTEDKNTPASYAPNSLYAYHTALGLDYSDVTEATYASCSKSGCHSWETVLKVTDGMFEGVGQIGDANPHSSHASNAYECGDCHSVFGASILVCDECHVFSAPEGWEEMDKTTTTYGLTDTEPRY